MNEQLIESVTDWIARFDEDPEHLLRTVFWAKHVANHQVSEAVILACLLHDFERNFPIGRIPPTKDGKDEWDDSKFLEWHAYRSAKFVREFLEERAADQDLIDRVVELVQMHEFGGDDEADLVKDADSLSFLEMHAKLFCDWLPGEESCRQAMTKLKMMYERISYREAEELAKPFYEEAVSHLSCKLPQN